MPIHFYFGKHWEGHAIIDLAEFGYLTLIIRVLIGKLIAGEAQNYQSLIAILQVKFFKAFELWCEAAFAGGINHQNYFTFKLIHAYFLSVDGHS